MFAPQGQISGQKHRLPRAPPLQSNDQAFTLSTLPGGQPHIYHAGENFENRGLVLRGSLRDNVFSAGVAGAGKQVSGGPLFHSSKEILEEIVEYAR